MTVRELITELTNAGGGVGPDSPVVALVKDAGSGEYVGNTYDVSVLRNSGFCPGGPHACLHVVVYVKKEQAPESQEPTGRRPRRR